MPHTGFKCPDPEMWTADALTPGGIDKIVPIADCLDCSLSRLGRECPYDFADLWLRQENSYHEEYSPSRFNGCDRELYLRMNNDYWTDPAEQTYRVRGSVAHAMLELEDPRVICETRVYRELLGEDGSPMMNHEGHAVIISVKPDKVYPTLRQIHDDKTWKYLPSGNVARGKIDPQPVKTENRLQLSVGAWAWQQPLRIKGPKGVWPSNDPIRIETGQIIIRDGTKQLRQEGIELVTVPVLERWMRLRVRQIDRARAGIEPPYISKPKRWRCATCPVRYLCGIPKEMYTKPKKEIPDGPVKPTRSPASRVGKPTRPASSRTRVRVRGGATGEGDR